MISLQLVLTAAADCTDLAETVRMVVAMTRIKTPRQVTWCDVVKCIRPDSAGDSLEGPTLRAGATDVQRP
jgi:hypothetical protein